MSDNFNTPQILLRLGDMVSACNVYMNSAIPNKMFLLVNKAATFITKMFRMLGLDDSGNQYAFMAKRYAYMYVCMYVYV